MWRERNAEAYRYPSDNDADHALYNTKNTKNMVTLRQQTLDSRGRLINTLRPWQNEGIFANDMLKHIFLNENDYILIKISLKFVPHIQINNIPSLVQKMALRGSGDKPLSEPMIFCLLTHICVTRPKLVKNKYVLAAQDVVKNLIT